MESKSTHTTGVYCILVYGFPGLIRAGPNSASAPSGDTESTVRQRPSITRNTSTAPEIKKQGEQIEMS